MTWILPLMVALPLAAGPLSMLLAKKRLSHAYALMIAVTAIELAAGLYLLGGDQALAFSMPSALGYGIHLKADGFRALYAAVASFMWLMTSLLTPQYMAHGHSQGRYCMYTLLTMGATVGVFLSDDLITAFLFFEILSFTSYCWVIHEETPGARRAGQTYVAIAILGGMTMLMGLMMLHKELGRLNFDQLAQLSAALPREKLYLPGALILAGFGAKAGMFPLHVWLPKAHPVAPAPASALLSGVLTKVGIFGILVISSRLFFGDLLWGNLLLVVGLINMLLGALLALFSTDLKRTLACSSMSQIGFILVGIGMQGLLSEHNALAAMGTVLHMLNHSLIKLVLFMAAGVVYINLHQLALNDIRGFGRGKWGLMACFLVGAASISGLPLFSGYASKTLLHEAIVEYIVHLQHLSQSAFWYIAAEWVFIISGGITMAYMIKLFVAIFIEKHPTRQAEYEQMGRSMKPMAAVALGGSALLLFLIGLWPNLSMDPLALKALPFLLAHPPAHEVHYLAMVNVVGGAKSWVVGILTYLFVVRRWLIAHDAQGLPHYVNRWPQWLDLEEAVYRPLLKLTVTLGTGLARAMDAVEHLAKALGAVATLISRFLESLVDGLTLWLVGTLLRRSRPGAGFVPAGNRLTAWLGRFWDRVTGGLRSLFGMPQREPHHYVFAFAAAWDAAQDNLRRLARTLSFSLILFGIGLVILLAYLLLT